MKKKLNIVLAAACMLAAAIYLPSCQKDAQKKEITQIEAGATTARDRAGSGSVAAAKDLEYSLTDVTVELTDEGRESIIATEQSEVVKIGENLYRTVKPSGPVQPYDPILCDGMTYSQVWADISRRYNNFIHSSAGINAQNLANALCRPVFICISNCAVSVMYAIQPTRRCITLAEYVRADRIPAQLAVEQP